MWRWFTNIHCDFIARRCVMLLYHVNVKSRGQTIENWFEFWWKSMVAILESGLQVLTPFPYLIIRHNIDIKLLISLVCWTISLTYTVGYVISIHSMRLFPIDGLHGSINIVLHTKLFSVFYIKWALATDWIHTSAKTEHIDIFILTNQNRFKSVCCI